MFELKDEMDLDEEKFEKIGMGNERKGGKGGELR
jgi:hypothetical protein